MLLNQDNTDEIYSAENVQVKSSYGDKRFILKSKMQKIRRTQIFTKTIFAGTQQLHLKQMMRKEYVLLKIWLKFLLEQDNYLQTKNLDNVCGFKILTIAILAGTKQLYLMYNLRQNKAQSIYSTPKFLCFSCEFDILLSIFFFFFFVKKRLSYCFSNEFNNCLENSSK